MFATLCLPDFFLQAAVRHQGLAPRQPVALIDGEQAKALIIQLNQSARERGVHCGMTPSQGLARCLQLEVKTRQPAQEDSLGAMLYDLAYSLSPFVEITAPGVCTVQFPDHRPVVPNVNRVIKQLAECQITARAGIAPTADTSLLAAHLARPVLQVGDVRTFLASLPIETLAIA